MDATHPEGLGLPPALGLATAASVPDSSPVSAGGGGGGGGGAADGTAGGGKAGDGGADPVAAADIRYAKLTFLGKGAMGRVYLVRGLQEGGYYAMKSVEKAKLIGERTLDCALVEREVLASADSPFVCSLHAAYQTSHRLYLLLEYAEGGTLRSLQTSQPDGRFVEATARFYAAEIFAGLAHIHELGYVYRDLKTENILVRKSGHLVLTDFDLCLPIPKSGSGGLRGLAGTVEYVAPEMIEWQMGKTLGYGPTVDWWSFGVLLYDMLFGDTPFRGANRVETMTKIMEGSRKTLKIPSRPKTTSACKSLLKGLVVRAEKRLPTVAKIKAHSFFKIIEWSILDRLPPPARRIFMRRRSSHAPPSPTMLPEGIKTIWDSRMSFPPRSGSSAASSNTPPSSPEIRAIAARAAGLTGGGAAAAASPLDGLKVEMDSDDDEDTPWANTLGAGSLNSFSVKQKEDIRRRSLNDMQAAREAVAAAGAATAEEKSGGGGGGGGEGGAKDVVNPVSDTVFRAWEQRAQESSEAKSPGASSKTKMRGDSVILP